MGGRYGESALVVAVQVPAVDGRATRAALKALAEALGIPSREVTLVSGAKSRTKLVEVSGDHSERLQQLLEL